MGVEAQHIFPGLDADCLAVPPSRVAEIAEFNNGAEMVRGLRTIGDADALVAGIVAIAWHVLDGAGISI